MSPAEPGAIARDREAIARDLGDRYRVTRYIASGGFASVWEAVDTLDGTPLAVKRLHAKSGRPGDFFRELRAMFALEHPNVLRIVNFLETGPARYLLLEYCAGGSLRQALNRGRWAERPCPPGRAAGVVRQLAAALAAAHARGLTHRDVKPENVLFADGPAEPYGGRSTVKLADFGLTSLRAPDDLGALRGLTGSPAYMSPEQFTARFGPPSDVYSLGVLAYELLTGDLPFQGSPEDLAYRHLRQEPPTPAGVEPAWRELLAATLAKDPAARPTAAEVEARARRLTPAVPATALAPVARPPARPAPTTHALPRSASRLVERATAGGASEFLAQRSDGFFVVRPDAAGPTFVGVPGLDELFPGPAGAVGLRRGAAVLRWCGSELLPVGALPARAECVHLFTGRGGETEALTIDGDTVRLRDVATGLVRWGRGVPRGGLPAGGVSLADGTFAVTDFDGGPGLRFLGAGGEDLARLPLPGICRRLGAWPAAGGCFARLLTGEGFELFRAAPGHLRRLPDSGGATFTAAGPDGPLLACGRQGKLLAWSAGRGRAATELPMPPGATCHALASGGGRIAVLWSSTGGHHVSLAARGSAP